MLAYAAPRPGREGPRAKTLLLIVAGHVAAISAVMLARSELPGRIDEPPLTVEAIPIPPDPPLPQPVRKSPEPAPSRLTTPTPVFNQLTRHAERPEVPADTGPTNIEDGPGTAVQPLQPPADPPVIPHSVVRVGPRLATPEALLRPPYPDSKRMMGEEATLALKLTIDGSGRVVAVEPVGAADRAFLESARRHLLRNWRFVPATEDGKPVTATKVITLHFELGEA